ncbi:MAG: hypothetical protein JSW65_08425 [Candidatus Bipolaricaulota bacterium]|nr:MAG: hypothetical protein JSW65_08425 [Candidatus Bipolaricaulota bacterium]
MKSTCAHCGKRRGARNCPALGAAVCARCCGADRLVRIQCPASCVHLQAHEPFQLQRQGERYRDAWWGEVRGISKEEVLALNLLERCLVHALSQEQHATDGDAERALHELEARLSPIEIVSAATTPLARALLSAVEEVVTGGGGSKEMVREAIPRALRILDALRDEESLRAFVRGLVAWVAAQPPPSSRKRSGLIVTPEELRAAQEGGGAAR